MRENARELADRFASYGVRLASEVKPKPKRSKVSKVFWSEGWGIFWVHNGYPIRKDLRDAGFRWNVREQRWETKDADVARQFAHIAGNGETTRRMNGVH